MGYTISLGMIVKNEARTIVECLQSAAPFVHQIVIAYAGESTDDTRELVEKFGHEWSDENHKFETFDFEWIEDFSAARNAVLERCDQDYYLWLDGDDVLVNGDQMQVQMRLHPNIDSFYFGYNYAQDSDGNCTCYLIRERLVQRRAGDPDWKWLGKVHEVLVPQFPNQMVKKSDDIVVVHHKPAGKHEADRNIRILDQQLREQEPNPDPRILVYLGSENMGRGNLREAILHLQRFVKLSGWEEEKYQAQVRIANAYRALGDIPRSIAGAQAAISIMPEWPDAYYAMAKAYASDPLNNWKAALEYMMVGASKPKPETMLIINPLDYTYDPALMIATCYVQLGDLPTALENYMAAWSVHHDPLVENQIRMLHKEIERGEVAGAILKLREYLGRHDEWLKARKLFDVIPKSLEQHSGIHDAWIRTMDQTAHVTNPQVMVDLYTSNPHWFEMPEESFAKRDWLQYPRMRFALEVASRVDAKKIVDWGCSDGFISLPLARELGAYVHGFDIDPRCVDLATVRGERWGVDSKFDVGNIDDVQLDGSNWQSEKADLAIFFEIIEHVVDPAATLTRVEQTAKHVAITTPFLSWEDGNIPDWDRNELKGHIRVFDQYDLERLLTGRGKIHNIYREPWGNAGWLFADYTPGEFKPKDNVIIGAMMGLEAWGPRKLKEGGLGGSETAVIRLAEALAKNNRRPIVYNPVDEPGYYNDVCYRPSEHFRPEISSDLFIAWRMPEAADMDINTRHLALWFHDTDAGDRLTPERAKKFDSFVVLTEWHRDHIIETYPFIDKEKIRIIPNGVEASRFEEPVVRNPMKVVYSSSPDRGLDVILEHIWPRVVKEVPDAQLHVYYGWENFDKTANIRGYEYLKEFRSKVERLMLATTGVVQHGRIPQDRLAKEMQEASIWLYPTYFSETYCITAVEAQLAGCLPITNKLAGLAETVQSGIIIDGDVHDPAIHSAYVDATINALRAGVDDDLRQGIKERAPAVSWEAVARGWEALIPPRGADEWLTFSSMLGGTPSSEDPSASSPQPSEPNSSPSPISQRLSSSTPPWARSLDQFLQDQELDSAPQA